MVCWDVTLCCVVGMECNAVKMSVNADVVTHCHIPEALTLQNRYLFARNVLGRSDFLRTGRSGVWTPVWARDFVVYPSRTALRPAQCLLQWVGLPWVKRPMRGIDHPPSSSTEVKNKWSYPSVPVITCYLFEVLRKMADP